MSIIKKRLPIPAVASAFVEREEPRNILIKVRFNLCVLLHNRDG